MQRLREVGVKNASSDRLEQFGVAPQGFLNRDGEATGNAPLPQFGKRWRRSAWAIQDSGWPFELPDRPVVIGCQMPEG